MKKNLFYVCISFIVLPLLATFYLQESSVDNTLKKWISKNCDFDHLEKPCVLVLQDVVNKPWDKVYVSNDGSQFDIPPEIEKLDVMDDDVMSRRIIFLKGDKLVHYEKMKTDLEKNIKGEPYFYINGKDWPSYTPQTALFTVTLRIHEGGYYLLTPVSEEKSLNLDL